jgi:hypothetical protein
MLLEQIRSLAHKRARYQSKGSGGTCSPTFNFIMQSNASSRMYKVESGWKDSPWPYSCRS